MLAANLGVIAGIIFLAIELQQNNQLLEAQARSDRDEVRRLSYTRWMEYPELLEARIKFENNEQLSDTDVFLLQQQNGWTLSDWQSLYREYQYGLIEKDLLPITTWRRVFKIQTFLEERWPSVKDSYETAFVEWMESEIVN